MYRREKVGSILLIFAMLTFLFAGVSSLLPKINISFSELEQTSESRSQTEYLELNDYYYCPGCYLTYTIETDSVYIAFNMLRQPAIYALFFEGQIRIYNATFSVQTSWYDIIYFSEFGNAEIIEIILIEFPQSGLYWERSIVIKELWYLDNITIKL